MFQLLGGGIKEKQKKRGEEKKRKSDETPKPKLVYKLGVFFDWGITPRVIVVVAFTFTDTSAQRIIVVGVIFKIVGALAVLVLMGWEAVVIVIAARRVVAAIGIRSARMSIDG